MKKVLPIILFIPFVLLFCAFIAFAFYTKFGSDDEKVSVFVNSLPRIFSNESRNENQAALNMDTAVKEWKSLDDSPWNWKTTRIMGTVLEVNKESSIIKMMITFPKDKSFSGTFRNVKVSCTSDNSALFSFPSMKFIRSNIDFLNYAKRNSIISAYCLTADCTDLGRECIVFDNRLK